MNFEEALEYLLSLGHETLAIKLGLRNTELLLEALGNPHRSYESVQIAGTNGKGSTAVLLDSILRAAGIHAGLYTSPHLVSITERIKISGHEISKGAFARIATEVRSAADRLMAGGKLIALPTFFEHVTAIALLAFKEAAVKLAILETGLGGRLDATTVAGAQTVAITPVALDHQEYLGETLAEIAEEKAAIIRPSVTAVIAEQPQEAREVILRRCGESGVNPVINQCLTTIESVTDDGRFKVTFDSNRAPYENVLIGLRGRHQIQNAAVSLQVAEALRSRAFEIPKLAILEGIESAEYAGRLELHSGSPSVLLDGAHNPSGALALRQYLDEFVSKPLTLIFGAMKDKKVDEIAASLFPLADNVILTRPDNPRAAALNDLKRLALNFLSDDKISLVPSASEALQQGRRLTPSKGLICVTGSLYLVGEVKGIMNAETLSCVGT